jgi:hypothetical protein
VCGALSVLTAACAPSGRLFLATPPVASGTLSVVYAVEAPGGGGIVGLIATAPTFDDDFPASFKLAANVRDAVVSAQAFPLPLSALGLSEGAVAIAEPGAPSHRLPKPAQIFVATLADRAIRGDWVSESELDPTLAALAIAGAGPPAPPPTCASWIARTPEVPTTGAYAFAAAVDADHAIYGTLSGELVLLTATASPSPGAPTATVAWAKLTPIVLPPGTPAFRSAYVFPDSGGEIWLSSEDGHGTGPLWTGRLSGATLLDLAPTATSAGDLTLRWMDGSKGGSGRQILGLSRTGVFAHSEGAGMQPIGHYGLSNPRSECGGVAWAGPGQALIGYGTWAVALEVFGADTWTYGTTAPSGGLCSVAIVPGIGTLAGTSHGEVYRRPPAGSAHQNDVWTRIGDDDFLPYAIDSIVPFRDGFVQFGDLGWFAQYRPDNGFCMKVGMFESNTLAAFPFGGGLIAIGKSFDGSSVGLAVVTPTDR